MNNFIIIAYIFFVVSFFNSNALPPLSYEGYDLYIKSDNIESFPYSLNQVCNIRQIGGSTYAYIEDAYSFQRTATVKLNLFNTKQSIARPLACFNFNGYSYILYKFNNTSDSVRGVSDEKTVTHIMRGRIERSFKWLFDYRLFSYDHLFSKLYFLTKDNLLYQVELTSLEKLWIFNKQNFTINNLYFKVSNLSNYNIDNLIVFNNTIYAFNNNGIWRGKIKEALQHYKINASFKFIFFLPYQRLSLMINNLMDAPTALSSISPTISLSIPPPPKVDNNGIIAYIFYMLNIFLMLLLIYLCRMKIRPYKNKSSPILNKNNDIYLEVVSPGRANHTN